ncbi:hypothetical protein K439DRAFT_1623945 [Ramaria rubella]|nr:hypothetical protein K439DRAFT_1623945 [Ramaria rubella]
MCLNKHNQVALLVEHELYMGDSEHGCFHSRQLPVNLINHLICIQLGVQKLHQAPKTQETAILRAIQAEIAVDWSAIQGAQSPKGEGSSKAVCGSQAQIELILQEEVHAGCLKVPQETGVIVVAPG